MSRMVDPLVAIVGTSPMQEQDQEQFAAMLEHYAKAFNELLAKALTTKDTESLDMSDFLFNPDNYQQLLSSGVEVDAGKLMKQQMEFMEKQTALWQEASKAMLGEKAATVVEEPRSDRRFSHDEWKSNPVFNNLKQSYLLN